MVITFHGFNVSMCFYLVYVVNCFTPSLSFLLSFCLSEVCVSAVLQPSMSQYTIVVVVIIIIDLTDHRHCMPGYYSRSIC